MDSIIFGKNTVFEAIISGRRIEKIFIHDQKEFVFPERIEQILKNRNINVYKVKKQKIEAIAKNLNHQGIAAVCSGYSYFSLNELLNKMDKQNNLPLFLILDSITDERNFGSIIRCACSVSCDAIIIPKNKSVSLSPTVAKTSSGAIEYIKVSKVSNISQTIEKLKKFGFWIFAADSSAEKTCFDVRFSGPVAIIIGSEGKGISRLVREKSDFLIKIPMFGNVKSLNASVAAAVIMYEVLRQRKFCKH